MARNTRSLELVGPAAGFAPRAPVIVGLGASAGALRPLEAFFDHLPGDTGMAFVVVQHLERHHPSVLAELLARHTPMPVRQIEDGVRVDPDHVYIIAPNTALVLEGDLLRTVAPAEPGPRTPIDAFFTSLAVARGARAVGIILSGTGTDGTIGARSLREHGGVVFAQAPETAEYDDMPRNAVDAGLVDFALPVETMATRLQLHAAHLEDLERDHGKSLDDDIAGNLAEICLLVHRHTGHDFSQYKRGSLLRRINRRVRILGVTSAPAYLRELHREPAEAEALLKDLLIGVTSFFRDPATFELLAERVLPAVAAGGEAGPSIRIWVPGCASGEEAYTIAILVREHLERLGVARIVQIFATDIDDEVLATARLGRYTGDELRDHVSPARLERFFTRDGDSFQVTKELRQLCTFSAHSLIKDPPFSSLDLISCRNLLIYLGAELQKKLVPLFHFGLRPGGFLLLGPSEDLAAHPELFVTVDKKHRLFQRSETVTRPPLELPPVRRTALLAGASSAPAVPDRASQPLMLSQAFERLIRDEYAPPCAVVNDQGEILYLAGRTSRYLQAREGPPSNNLLDEAQPTLRSELRAALSIAVKTHTRVVRDNVPVDVGGDSHRLRLTVRPLPGVPAEAGLYVVVMQEAALASDALPVPPTPAREAQIIEQLEDDLRASRTDLQAALQDLETSNEELKSANEELTSTNEELHAANEELQSSREELQTVNDELREKVQALDDATNDLQNHHAGTQIATIFLDRELRVTRFTPGARSLFRLLDGDIGRPLADLAPRFRGESLLADAHTVLKREVALERHVQSAEGTTWFLMRMLPYRTAAGVVAGVGISCVDITELLRAQEAERRYGRLSDAIFVWRIEGGIEAWNHGAEELLGYDVQEMSGRDAYETLRTRLPRPWSEISAVLRNSGRWEGELVHRAKDGHAVVVSAKLELMPGEGGPDRVLEADRDVTERNRAEEALREIDRRKDDFMAILSHELRNPLAPIRNSLAVLDRAPHASEQARRAKAIIGRQVDQLARLVDDLLDVARISRGKLRMQPKTLDLGDLVRRCAEDHRAFLERGGLELQLTVADEPVWVSGDAARLAQALGNLMQNAAKFTNRGGRVHVALDREEAPATAVIRVRDTGVGISAEALRRLFSPFMQVESSLERSRGGLGLGLALVRELVALHGGEVAASSEGVGAGAEFVIRLPLVAAPEAGAPNDGAPAVTPRRVLVIEDNVDAAESLGEALRLDAHHVEVAYDGPSGLEKAQALQPEIVLCDIGLPGMDGYEVVKAFRADPRLRSSYFVALTGYAMPEQVAKAAAAGFDHLLAKPPAMSQLSEVLASAPRTTLEARV